MKSTYQNSISGTGFYAFSTNKKPWKEYKERKEDLVLKCESNSGQSNESNGVIKQLRMKKRGNNLRLREIVDFLIQWKEILQHTLFPDLDRYLLL